MHKFVLSCLSACAFLAAAQSAAAAPTVTKFSFTGAEQDFTVPAGVTSMHVVAIGGKGGTGAGNTKTGGFGAVVSADIAVTPGQVLEVLVGGNGGDAAGTTGGSGGFNNGAKGGDDGPGTEGGGGGGGMSDVLDPTQTFFTGVLVLAAGGGGSGGGPGSGGGGNASDADGKNGQAGGDGDAPSSNGLPTARGGGGGITSAGGTGGASGGTAGHVAGGGAGTDGSGIDGGAAGGGGGAGRWGGGGGGSFSYSGARAGGGGAGSNTSSADKATNTSYSRDTTGVPSITFTYDLPTTPGGGGGGGGGGGNPRVPNLVPVLSDFKASPRTFVAASRGGSTGGTTGMTISYTNAVQATTKFTVLAPRHGVRSGRRCVKPGRGKHGKSCTRYVSLGSFTHQDVAGFNTFVFTGRLRHRKLSRGSYRLQAISSANGKKSKAVTLTFRIAS
jgi:hypothetical protein